MVNLHKFSFHWRTCFHHRGPVLWRTLRRSDVHRVRAVWRSKASVRRCHCNRCVCSECHSTRCTDGCVRIFVNVGKTIIHPYRILDSMYVRNELDSCNANIAHGIPPPRTHSIVTFNSSHLRHATARQEEMAEIPLSGMDGCTARWQSGRTRTSHSSRYHSPPVQVTLAGCASSIPTFVWRHRVPDDVLCVP